MGMKKFFKTAVVAVGVVALAASMAWSNPAKKNWPRTLVIGSASIGGTYYVYGSGWAQIIEKVTGIPTSVEVTGGPNHNMMLTNKGDLDLGMVTMGPAFEAWNGLENWTNGVKHREVRAIFPMYNTYSQWWATEASGIKTLADLEGKRVGVGPQGGTAGTFHPRILSLLGIKATVRHAGISDLVGQHMDGQLEANSFAAGLPVGAVLEMANQRKIVMFGVDGADREKVVKEYPYFAPATIPASAYDFLQNDVETIGIWNMAIASKKLPDDLVYEIVKGVFENHGQLVNAHSAAKETEAEAVTKNTWMWMHPGAIRYYEEKGIALHPDVYPPEYKKQ